MIKIGLCRQYTPALESVGNKDKSVAQKVADQTIATLKLYNLRTPDVDQINTINVKSLSTLGYDDVARSYERYARERKKIRVLGATAGKGSTDGFLMVTSINEEMAQPWSRERIIISLVNEAALDYATAERIGKEIENKIILSSFAFVTTQLIRELIHTEMLKRGLHNEAQRYRNFSIPFADLQDIMLSHNKENSNIQMNNPEAVNFTISGRIGKEYALTSIFSRTVADAHTTGMIHLHDLDLPTRVYCSAHSLEYIKKYGLVIDNLQTSSKPAKHTETLTGHLNTFFAAMQAFYAGALGLGYVNIFYAPLIMSDLQQQAQKKLDAIVSALNDVQNQATDQYAADYIKKMNKQFDANPLSLLTNEEIDDFLTQRGQELIYAASQNAFSRGGQTLFIDFNIHTGIPSYLEDTPSIEPGGKYAIIRDGKKVFMKEERLNEEAPSGHPLIQLRDLSTDRIVMREKITKIHGSDQMVQEWFLEDNELPVTYKMYDYIAKRFAKNLLKIWHKGDKNGQPFAFPKCDLHINDQTFTDPEQLELLHYAAEVAADNGSPYFVFDRDEVSLAACCRLRTAVEDLYVLKHPESIRFCGFQNITINLPQAAYRAAQSGKKDLDLFLCELDNVLEIVIDAHLQKRAFIKQLQHKGLPQWLTGKEALDGVPYIELDKATYIIGIIGLNEAVSFLTGKQLHEQTSEEFEKISLRVVSHLYLRAKEYQEKHGLKFSLEESPAESATRRMSKIDSMYYPESKQFIKGDQLSDKTYYTNSIHITPDAPVDLFHRIELQSKFHPAIESGAIIHAFIGDQQPHPDALFHLIERTFTTTQSAQLTISPEFTICRACAVVHRGIQQSCPKCGNTDPATLKHMTRIVGYYSFIDNWNPSKQSELDDRHNGNYAVMQGMDTTAVPSLQNDSDGLLLVHIGKADCELCKDVSSVQNLKKIAQKHNASLDIKTYEVQTHEGLAAAMLGSVNLSALPSIILLDEQSNVILRESTQYTNGIPVAIDLPQVAKKFDNLLKDRSK